MKYNTIQRRTVLECSLSKLKFLSIFFLLTSTTQLRAQINCYTFASSSGTYVPLTVSRTTIFTATLNAITDPGFGDNTIYTLPDSVIPFDFYFDGWAYRKLKISTNGFITFDTISPATADFAPLNSILCKEVVSALGEDLNANVASGNLGEISYEVIGAAPNRSFVIQFSKFRRKSTATTFTENYNFQIRLNENGGVIGKQTVSVVYGACISTTTTTTSGPQVGLRGINNFFPAQISNRTTTTSWLAPTAGTTSISFMQHTTTLNPASGQTYTWSPQLGESCTDNPITIPVFADSASAFPVNNATAYGFGTSTAGVLNPMSGATIIVGSSVDDAPMALSGSTPGASEFIGFDFLYEGKIYTHFSASPDGWIKLGTSTAAASAENNNSLTSSSNAPRISPYWDNLATGSTGNVKMLVAGSSPHRILSIQWFVTIPRNTGGAANSTFQAWLYESTGLIEFRYGTMGTATGTVSSGLTGLTSTTFNSITFSTNTASTSTANNSQVPGALPVSGRLYSFTTSGATGGTLLSTGFTQDGPNALCSDNIGNSPGRDRWVKFVAPASGSRLILTTIAGTNNDMLMEIWTGCPGSGYARLCIDDVNGFMPELELCNYTGGGTYYVRLWPYYVDSIGNFTIKIYQNIIDICPTPPSNNDCQNATTLAVQLASAYIDSAIAGTTIDAYLGPDSNPSCALPTDTVKDVWYSFNSGNNCNLNLFISPNFGIVNFTLVLDCGFGAIVCVTNIDGFYVLKGLIPNTNYKIRVWSTPFAVANYAISLSKTPIPVCTTLPLAPIYGSTGIADCGTLLKWRSVNGACGYDIYLNTGNGPATVLVSSNFPDTIYNTGALLPFQNYAWMIVPRNSNGTAPSCSTFLFTTGGTDDGNTCTIDACNPQTGIITHTNNQPPAPTVNVVNNCGNSVLTASGYTGNLLWSTSETTASITVNTSGVRTVTQQVNGCTGPAGSGNAVPVSVPNPPTVTVTNNCGTSLLTASNFTGSLLWSTGATTTSITVPSGSYTVSQTVNSCTSGFGAGLASPNSIPSTPSVSVNNQCGNSILTAGNIVGTVLWSTGATTSSITVSSGGSYTVTQTANGCTSGIGSGSATPVALPPTPGGSAVNNCGNSVLTASGYTGTLLWSTSETTASITEFSAGNYTVTQTSTVTGCTSLPKTIAAAPLAIPSTPTVSVQNNCGSSVLTAANYSGNLLWNTSATTASITVSSGGTYSVTQTNVSTGCISAAGGNSASPISIPSAPTVNVVNNCGTSQLTASNYNGTLLWSTGATTSTITVSVSGTYSVTQTINGCASLNGSNSAVPKNVPIQPTVTVQNNCSNSTFTASNYTGTLLWSTGATTVSITVSSGTRTVTQTVLGCVSPFGSGTAQPKAPPTPPSVSANNHCGSTTLTAGGLASGATLAWSTGATTNPIEVSANSSYTVTQTGTNGCASQPGNGSATPLALPSTPSVTVADHCTNSTLTASNFTGPLTWSTGANTTSVTVAAGTYTVTQLGGNGCTSMPGSGTASPVGLPSTPGITVSNTCGNSLLTATGYSGTLLWSTGATTASINVSSAGSYSVTQTSTVTGCTSNGGNNTAAPLTIPPAPSVSVTNNCGNSVLKASGYTGTLLWSTSATIDSIVVTSTASYSVVQTTANGCTSTPGSNSSSPKTIPVSPTVTVTNNCGSSTLTASNYTGSLLWNTGATTASINSMSPANYTITQTTSNGCTSPGGNGSSAPKTIPAAPGVSVTNNCATSNLTATGYSGTLSWSTGATTASINVSSAGSYSVTQTSTVTGCTSTGGNGTATPLTIPPAPSVSVTNNCGNSVLKASGYTGTLLWSTSATIDSVVVTSTASYSVVQTTANGCTSTPGSNSSSPKTIPVSPTITVTNNCGSSTLSASNYTGSLLWNTGATTASINSMSPANYTITQTTVNGCTSPAGNGSSAPKTIPAAPGVSVTNNCGTSNLTATGYSGTLLWSTGATTGTVTVSGGNYTVTLTAANGCTNSGSGNAAPKSLPVAPAVNASNSCTQSILTATGYSGSLLWNTGATTSSITLYTAGTYSVQQTGANGCTSLPGSGFAAPVAPKPTVTIINNCNSTDLVASDYTGSLLWSTGATTASITLTTAGTISVTQTVSACTSLPVTNNFLVYSSFNNITFNIKMFIEGFYVSAGVMRARVDPINYPTLCDSVTLEIHQDFTPFNVAYTIPGLLDIYGNATFPMQQVQCGRYYLAIRHLSGIETWCKSPFIVGNPATNFDLSR